MNLLPLLQQATALRRVVSVFAGTKEGPIYTNDFQARKEIPLLAQRGHLVSMVTLSLAALAKEAPDVSFIHDYPGAVKSGIGRGAGVAMFMIRTVFTALGPLINIPITESGERHLFLATSAMYPASMGDDTTSGVSLASGLSTARGIGGGSGVYTVDSAGQSAGPKVEDLLADFEKDGTADKLWKHTEEEFKRIGELEKT